MGMGFGDYVRDLRLAQKKTLRQFCHDNGLDPSNWSKVERGVNPPPKDDAILNQWPEYFGIKPKTDAWEKFMDVARISRGEIPKDILDDEKAVALLPAFFRTVRGAEVGEDEVKKLIQKIKEANTPDGK
jgi:transcriptional regulator with XRE-family HTH domain